MRSGRWVGAFLTHLLVVDTVGIKARPIRRRRIFLLEFVDNPISNFIYEKLTAPSHDNEQHAENGDDPEQFIV